MHFLFITHFNFLAQFLSDLHIINLRTASQKKKKISQNSVKINEDSFLEHFKCYNYKELSLFLINKTC